MENTVSAQIITLLHTHHLLTAPQLVTKLHEQGRTVNKTSVYRALEKLENQGVICKQNLHDNDLVYELRQNHHDHLVCTTCGKITPTECHVEVNTQENFAVNHHHLTVFGTCQECVSRSP